LYFVLWTPKRDLEVNLPNLRLQASLPETTHPCTENKFTEKTSNLRQPDQR